MNKIRGKLWTLIVLNICVIFAIIWVFQIVLLEKYYIYQRTKIMEQEIKNVSSMIEANVPSKDVLNEIIEFGSSYNCLVIVTDENFNIAYTSFSTIQNSKPIIQETIEYMKTKITPKTEQTIKSIKSDGKSILMGISVKDAQEGYIIIQSYMAPINETVDILKQQLMGICLISLFIGSSIAFVFANKFSKPILEINRVSQNIAKGDFDTVVSVNTKDEVAILAQTINHMASQLKQTDNIKKQFIANISHELKTPISSIRAYGELLQDCEIIEKEEIEKYSEVIIMNSKKLNAMVEDILELSEIQSGNYVLELSSFCLIGLIKNIINDLQALAREKNVQILLEASDDTLLIKADKDKIYSAFCNILHNAVKHSHLNGIIEIKIESTTHNINISVMDKGVGISEDNLPHIWERFYKVDKSRKSGISGAGLGMAIVKEVFELHQYTYGIESQVDVGTRVWFTIPKK